VLAEGQEQQQAASIYHRLVTPGLLDAMRIPLLRGRDVGAADGPDAPPVAVISARLAARLWPGQDPLGKRLRIARQDSPWRTVVGVAHDVHERFDVKEAWYLPYSQNAATPAAEVLELMVRGPVDPASLGVAVRQAVASVDPELAISDLATMEGVRAETLTQERVAAQTVSLFALLGLSLAAIGTYGVISYAMARRTRELAIRAALGAAPRALIQLVMGRGFMLAGIGIAGGVGAAMALHRVVASQLTQVAASDPRIHGGVSLVLLGVAALATWLPARRAVKVDPAIALRAE
jgi:putative ABC transport system permease protein